MKLLFLLIACLLPLGLRAQVEPDGEYQWVRLPQYQLQYHVPADWTPLRQTTDTSLVITYHNPDRTLLFSAGKLRGAAATTTPAQALGQLAQQYGVPVDNPTRATYDGIKFLESSGRGTFHGQPKRYQALAAQHRGHVLLVYVSGTPEAFQAHQGDINRILHSMTTYKRKAR